MAFANPPTLRRRMIVSLGLMVLGSLAIGGGSMFAVNGLHQDLGVAVQGYRQLRQLFGVGFLTAKAREAIGANPPQPAQAIAALQSSLELLNQRSDASSVDGPPSQWVDESARTDCQRLLAQSIDELNHGSYGAPSLNLLFARLSRISEQVRQSVAEAQKTADHRQQIALFAILLLCGIVVIGAVAIGIRQYRRVIRPLRRIGSSVRAFAQGEFDRRLATTGDQEFAALAMDFNKMADELSALYRDLEAKVQAKSKELVRQERLASIGYLAAGVAHEINNPLGIIAGYGERAIQQLSAGLDDSTLPAARKALTVMCEEAFRCKQIIDRLLTLARPTPENRRVISIATIAEAVVSTLSGLGTVGGRRLLLNVEANADLSVLADEGEMKQLLLNLVINALEAVDPGSGEVLIDITRQSDEIELSVNDNGHGMTAETLDRIFEPFFTDKRGQRPGTGLGLSIALAIVTDHGGRIEAASADTGSRFIVRLPAVAKESAHAAHQ